MKVEANAKINLVLDVVRRREDGYHDLRMIMLPLALHDTLEVTLAQEDRLFCDDPRVPLTNDNLIFRALSYLRKRWGMDAHFHIKLHKRIPMEAGLAGGSADAGAIIRAAMQLTKLEAPMEAVAKEAKQVGADVPFCVYNRCARVEGIGEQISALDVNCDFEILLVKPQSGVSTKRAYELLDFDRVTHPDVDLVERCLRTDAYETLCSALGNTLEYSAFLLNPQVAKLKEALVCDGVDAALMSGSGSTVFAIGRDHCQLAQLEERYRKQGYFTTLTKRRG